MRPSCISEFIGQKSIKSNLQVFIKAAKNRKKALDHTLFYGPPGLGKTTLAQIIANELGVSLKSTSGPVISKAADLAAILTNLQENDIFFIDEIHRLNNHVEEILYSAMEDFTLDIMIGDGPAAKSIKIDLPNFTLIGASTRLGLLSNPLRDRFGIPMRLDFYSIEELKQVLIRVSNSYNLEEDGANEIAKRSRGTPRIALRLLRRVYDFATVEGYSSINFDIASIALSRLEIDQIGLDSNDYKYLKFIANNYSGGPVGVETISAALLEQRDNIEDVIEPYLIQIGFLNRTQRGRVITPLAFKYLKNIKHLNIK